MYPNKNFRVRIILSITKNNANEDCKNVLSWKKKQKNGMDKLFFILKGTKQPAIKSSKSSEYMLGFENIQCLPGYQRN